MTGQSSPANPRPFSIVLILGGGNALGAFQAGIYQALHESGLEPDWIIGTSIGAINGALIAGNAPENRMDRLRDFWRPEVGAAPRTVWPMDTIETARRSAAAGWTMLVGRADLFGPLLSASSAWGGREAGTPAMFDTGELARTLVRTVDFDRLNDGPCRFTATAVDLQSGDDAAFDTRDRRVGVDHVRASAALPVAFPAVEVDGRWFVDGGVSANLPLDPLFASPPAGPVLCIAADLLHLHGRPPGTLGETAGRMQDLLFAAQSRRSLARWQERDALVDRAARSKVTLLRIAYAEQEEEVGGKAMDFSARSVRQRWDAGHAKTLAFIGSTDLERLTLEAEGLCVHQS